jgi:hypothetical protein
MINSDNMIGIVWGFIIVIVVYTLWYMLRTYIQDKVEDEVTKVQMAKLNELVLRRKQ